MLGAYLPGDGWKVEEIKKFNNLSEKSLAFVTYFSAFSHNWREHLKWQSSNIYNNGAIPLISWMPIDLSDRKRNLLPEIVAGEWDNYIDTWIAGLLTWVESYPKSKTPMVLLRFAHEFNGNWYPYSGEPAAYARAWQHIHDRFQNAGANNYVEWVWNVNHISFDDYNDPTQYYPGDRYVDWTAIDGYNWGTNHDWTEWDSFEQVFAAAYDTLISNYPTKPILIAEYGSTEPKDLPSSSWGQYGDNGDINEDRSAWFIEMLTSIENHFPAIRGIGLFSIDKELSWSLTSASSTGIQGYNTGIQSDHYTTNFLCTRIMNGSSRPTISDFLPIRRGSISVAQRELINAEVFSHSINTRKPPKKTVDEALLKSRSYRTTVRSISENQRELIAKKRLEVLDY